MIYPEDWHLFATKVVIIFAWGGCIHSYGRTMTHPIIYLCIYIERERGRERGGEILDVSLKDSLMVGPKEKHLGHQLVFKRSRGYVQH